MWTIPSTGQNIFRVSQTPNVDPYRMSTRISSKKSYSGGGLFVFDVSFKSLLFYIRSPADFNAVFNR